MFVHVDIEKITRGAEQDVFGEGGIALIVNGSDQVCSFVHICRDSERSLIVSTVNFNTLCCVIWHEAAALFVLSDLKERKGDTTLL